jgi:hypothetical protein
VRAYHLRRDQDVSGKSGTGRVAQVAVFDDGTAVVHWSGDKTKAAVASTEVFSSIEDMMRVHGHEGRTVLEPIPRDGDSARPRETELAGATVAPHP